MKDERLEKEFGEYFKGANTPDNITGGAKKYVKPKNKFMPKFVKFASVAASFVLVFAVAITVIVKSNFNKGSDSPGQDGSPSEFTVYTDGELKTETADAYSLSSLSPALKFIESFALADNADVGRCEAKYNDNGLALVKASVSVTSGLNRDETEIYVEFTEKNMIYGGLENYYDGSVNYYRGAEYYLTECVADNGEPEFRLYINYGGIKYYFSVVSSDERAYQKYLEIILK